MKTHNYYEIKTIYKVPLCPECDTELQYKELKFVTNGLPTVVCYQCGFEDFMKDEYMTKEMKIKIPIDSKSEIRMYDEFRRN